MKQPIAGVVPSETAEATITTIWPSIAVYPTGQWLGRQFSIKWPDIYIFRIGNLLALLSIPVAAFLYFCRVAPKIGIRYRMTNRRLIVERGLSGLQERSVDLSELDDVVADVKPGQEWYDAADLVFRHEGREVFRLEGVSRSESFRQTCLKTLQAYSTVSQVRQQQDQQAVG